MTEVHPIEVESYRILRSRIDLSALPPLTRAVTERIIHATADFDYVTDLVCDEMALAAGVEALRRDAPVIADVAMVASGITGYPVICKIGDSGFGFFLANGRAPWGTVVGLQSRPRPAFAPESRERS